MKAGMGGGWASALDGVAMPVLAAEQAGAGESRPDVRLIMSDDLAVAPKLDALARRGVRFDRAYDRFPHCDPSRTVMMSGVLPNSTRVTATSNN
jgi:arylsulfatase A-like enzyme